MHGRSEGRGPGKGFEMQRIPFKKAPNSLLTAFGRWFPASAGVWQTFLAVGVLTVLENTEILHDDHGFWLLYWLTVYSAVTQPVLGYVNRIDTARADAVLKQVQEILENIQAQESEELEILRARVQEIDENAQEGTL